MPRYREIISYTDMLAREGIALQKGMNFQVRSGRAGYSIILMSVRRNAPYQDQWHDDRNVLEYEGHDVPRFRGSTVDPKTIDQALTLASGKPSDNGKFYAAAIAAKTSIQPPEIVQVYEKIADGIWCDRGRHELIDAEVKSVSILGGTGQTRKVFRFYLKPAATPGATTPEDKRELALSRQIPTAVKVEVWKRDGGCCVQCGATDNLHFDHDVPFTKGGSSIIAANVKLLCARHNLEKSDKIISLGPLLGPLVAAVMSGLMRGA